MSIKRELLCLKILLNRLWDHGNASSLTKSLILDHQSQAVSDLSNCSFAEKEERVESKDPLPPILIYVFLQRKSTVSAKQSSVFTSGGRKLQSYFLHTIITTISSTQVKPKQTKEWKLQGSGRNRTNHLQNSSKASSATLRHKPLHFFPMTCETLESMGHFSSRRKWCSARPVGQE